MSIVKISELPILSSFNANTSNTLFVAVDLTTGGTYKTTASIISQKLYLNEILNVGINPLTLPNTVAQFAKSGESYIQTNLVNTNDGGSADIVVTANAGSGGTDSAYFIDMGFANKSYQPGQEFNNIGTSIGPLDGYLYVQGLNSSSNGGNLIIGATTSNGRVKVIAGGGSAANIVATFTNTGLTLNTQSYLTFADGTKQTTNSATYDFSQSLQAQTNTNTANITYIFSVNTNQNTSIQASFDKANNAIANTSGVVTAGNFNISGNLTVLRVGSAGLFTVNATAQSTNSAAFLITGSNNYTTQTPLNQGYMLQVTGYANTPTRIVSDSFGENAYPTYIGRTARGTASSPTSTQNNDILLRFSGNGWGATGFSQFGVGRIDVVAAENYTDTAKGSRIEFWNTKVGSNTMAKIASFNSDSVEFSGVVTPQKGFIWTPRTLPGIQTAITLDFSSDSVIRATTSAGLTVSFSNYVAGKVVDVWITNSAGTNQTFTHGCSALNSTTNSTTYTIPGTSTVYAKYISFGSDSGNTYVAIVHA
jgi:hypothetical protein